MKILVTGGAGFIGSHSVNFLLAQEKQVVVLDNLSSGKMSNLNLNHPNLEFIEGDILEYPLLEDLISNCDAVLHLAAIPSVPQSIENPIYTFQVNVQGFLHVLQAIHRAQRSIRLVYASSAAVYGNTKQLPCRDDCSLIDKPISPYALHKINNEEYAALYKKLHQVGSLGLRYFNVYGPNQDPHSPYSGVISYFMEAYKNDKLLTIFGDGLQSRDFIYVADVVTANWLALQSDYIGVLNIATGKPQTLLDMIKHLETAGQRVAKSQFEPVRPGDIKESFAAVELAKKYLNFNASTSAQEGIKQLLETAS